MQLDQSPVMFADMVEAILFAEKHNILIEDEIVLYDFSAVDQLIDEISKNCGELIGFWNFFQ